jgi:hypothetical protein
MMEAETYKFIVSARFHDKLEKSKETPYLHWSCNFASFCPTNHQSSFLCDSKFTWVIGDAETMKMNKFWNEDDDDSDE